MCIVILLLSSILVAAQHGTLVYTFGLISGDARMPSGNLIADVAGNLYGETGSGGTGSVGTVYELSPPVQPNGPWTETVLYSFAGGADGVAPIGSLVLDAAGNLYGATENGGNTTTCLFGCGTVFELSAPVVQGGNWTKTTIYTFSGGSDAAIPNAGLVFDSNGNLYGTTGLGGGVGNCGGVLAPGCGAVFELSPPTVQGGAWTETVLYGFTGGSDGALPLAPVVFDGAGNLYGTTNGGGDGIGCNEPGCGTVFELTPSGTAWTEIVLHSFSVSHHDGTGPGTGALLVDTQGRLAGTTVGGGANESGTVFGLQPPIIQGGMWTYTVLYSFGTSNNDGSTPKAGVILASGMLYGTTSSGGSNGTGTVFQLTSSGGSWKETKSFTYGNAKFGGSHPSSGLLLLNGALYGTTLDAGRGSSGTVFKVTQ